jgi:hypothetical protein
MAELLMQIPWSVIGVVVFVGSALIMYANARNNPRLRTGGLLAVSLAFLLIAARFMFDTPAELVERRTRNLVQACDRQDWPRLQALLDPETDIDLAGRGPNATGPDAIRKVGEVMARQIGLKRAFIISIGTDQENGQITVNLTGGTTADQTLDRPVVSNWEFDFTPAGDSWHLRHIKLLKVDDNQ